MSTTRYRYTVVQPIGIRRVVKLKSGETLTVSASLDLFSLIPNDRKFVSELIDWLEEYERGAQGSPAAITNDALTLEHKLESRRPNGTLDIADVVNNLDCLARDSRAKSEEGEAMSQHTPGPWKATMRDDGRWRVTTEDDEKLILQSGGKPNCLLIAAAPELLAWLTKAAQMADQQHRGGENIPMASAWRWLAENAQLTIAKATRREG